MTCHISPSQCSHHKYSQTSKIPYKQNTSTRPNTKMRFPYALIALVLGFISTVPTVVAQDDGPTPQHPQFPATQATPQVNNDVYEQTVSPELRVDKDSCSQPDQSSQACIEQDATRANSEDHAQQRHQQAASGSSSRGKAIRGSTRKPETRNMRVVFRSVLPARSVLYYRRRRYAEASWEFRMEQQRLDNLARRQHLGRLAEKYGWGYKLKVGNYQIDQGRMRMIFI